jgi:hypothetical protein
MIVYLYLNYWNSFIKNERPGASIHDEASLQYFIYLQAKGINSIYGLDACIESVIGQVLYTDRRCEGYALHASRVRPGGLHMTAKQVHASTSSQKLSLSLFKDSPRQYLILLLSITLPSPLPCVIGYA